MVASFNSVCCLAIGVENSADSRRHARCLYYEQTIPYSGVCQRLANAHHVESHKDPNVLIGVQRCMATGAFGLSPHYTSYCVNQGENVLIPRAVCSFIRRILHS